MYEYKVFDMLLIDSLETLEQWLNDLGIVGWQLIAILDRGSEQRYIFMKRL